MKSKQPILLEAIGAMVVLVILAAFVLPRFQQAQLISQIDDRKHDLEAILNALLEYELNDGPIALDDSFPRSLSWIASNPTPPSAPALTQNFTPQPSSTCESWTGSLDWPSCAWLTDQKVTLYRAQYGTNITPPFRNSIVWAIETATPFSLPAEEPFRDTAGTFSTTSEITAPPNGTYPFFHPPFHFSQAIPFEASNGLTSPGKLIVWTVKPIPLTTQ